MTYTLDSTYLIVAAIALLVGLVFGIAMGGGARKRASALAAKVRQLELDIDVREAEKVRMQRELASSSDQVRPLSDEVDRLRRERDQRKAAGAAAIAAAPVAASGTVYADPAPVQSASALTDPALVAPVDPLEPVTPIVSAGDDRVTLLKGVGERLAARLSEIGITGYRQIAAWTPADETAADAQLGSFTGRIARDRLVEQAQLLSAGRMTEYEARFGKLGA